MLLPAPVVVCFGECMIELRRAARGADTWAQGFAGDCYNVAAYLQRLGVSTAFMTALGHDEFSKAMLAEWEAEGIATALVLRHPDRIPGLYAIRLDDAGERSFVYWRGQSAARAFFECQGADQACAAAATARLLYVSGITLSLFDDAGRAKIMALAAAVRANGGMVAFDTNYRAKGWLDADDARAAFTAIGHYADIVLPTLEDEQALFGDVDAAACAQRWYGLGVREVVVKQGPHGALVSLGGEQAHVPAAPAAHVTDTTGAGDAFNAAYLAQRLGGATPARSAEAAALLAAEVVQSPGAILPRAAMPMALLA